MIIPGQGTLLQHGVTVSSVTTYTTVAGIITIGAPSVANNEKNRTELADTVVKTAKSIADAGEAAVQIHYDPASTTHALLYALFIAGTEEKWRLVFNDHATEASRSHADFDAWVKTFVPGGFAVEEDVVADMTIRLTSLPVITPRS